MWRAGCVAVHGAALLTSCWSPCAPARRVPPRVGTSVWVWAQTGFPAGQEEELVIEIIRCTGEHDWYTYRFVLLLRRLEHIVWDVTDLAFFILHLPPLLRHVQQLHTHTHTHTHTHMVRNTLHTSDIKACSCTWSLEGAAGGHRNIYVRIFIHAYYTLPVKGFWTVIYFMFFKESSFAHQDWINLIQNTAKTVKFWNISTICFLF